MQKKKLTSTQKKIIFLVGIMAGFLTAGLFSFIDPESKGRDFWRIISTSFPILFGILIAIIIQNKTMVYKTILFCLGIGLIMLCTWFLNIANVAKIEGLYIGGFLAGKSGIFNEMFKEKTEKVDNNLG